MCRDVTCVQHPRVVIDLQPSPYIPSDDEGVTRPTEHLFSTPEWIRRTFFPLPIPSKISPSVSPISYICRLTLLNDTRHAKFHSRKRSFAFLYPPVTNRISIHMSNIKKDFSPCRGSFIFAKNFVPFASSTLLERCWKYFLCWVCWRKTAMYNKNTHR